MIYLMTLVSKDGRKSPVYVRSRGRRRLVKSGRLRSRFEGGRVREGAFFFFFLSKHGSLDKSLKFIQFKTSFKF